MDLRPPGELGATACGSSRTLTAAKDDFDATIDQYIKHPELAKQLKRRSLPENLTRFLHEDARRVVIRRNGQKRSRPTRATASTSSFVFRNDPSHHRAGHSPDRRQGGRVPQGVPRRARRVLGHLHSGGKMSNPQTPSTRPSSGARRRTTCT
ncbi:hypothetical protein B0H14DRAFT_794816 [Mycena olivaceomarginata]|nr:hypothetical protein B0H14DRAFT_794816 [Mycena olivaceomarginata]